MMATTVESVLASLHTHLTSQTSLIPSLHAQLGLPPSALIDELNQLHAALVDTVDRKIEERRREVSEWMEKCAEVETDCIKHNKALGSFSKGVTYSVGELRKQQALPKRFEELTTYRDKIAHLYGAKLEQCTTLVRKVNGLIRIVGAGFFSPEVTSMMPIQGVPQEDPLFSLKDVSPERFGRLEKELIRAKGELHRRLCHLSQAFLSIGYLYDELGIPLPLEDDAPMLLPRSISTSSTSDPFLSASRYSGGSTGPSEDSVQAHQTAFARFVARLQEVADESFDFDRPGNETFGVEHVEPTVELMKWAEQTKADMIDLKTRREDRIQRLYNELDGLWRRLGVPEGEMNAFVEANRGSMEENVQAYEREYERMLELKRESMSTFIANARSEIERLWDELILGEEERGAFYPFVDDEHTEELLALHEKEITRLKEERRIKAPILAAVKKYYEICEEETELAAAASDQSRLLGRGPRDPGRLLREEKMRKRVTKEKPRLEKELMLAIPTWEQEYARPFLINGISILDELSDTIYAAEEKENRKRNRPGSVPPRGVTPQPTGIRQALTTPGHYGENLGATKSVPNKKQRVGLGNSSVLNSGGTSYSYHHASSSPHKPSAVHKSGNGKTPTSGLPRAVSTGKFGYGHPPAHGGHGGYRIPSGASMASQQGLRSSSIFSAIGNKGSKGPRESFKPRPSVEGSVYDPGASLLGGVRQWAQHAGRTVKEEPEY